MKELVSKERLVIMLLFMLLIPNAYAQGVPDSGAIDELLRTFETAAGLWPPVLRQYATYVFVALVTISWSWTFFWMAFKEANIAELLAELTRRSVMVGFFYWLLMDGTSIAAKIVEGFQFLAQALTGKYIHPSSIFDIGFSLASEIIKKLSWVNFSDSLGFVLAGLGILIIFALIALEMLLVIIQYYIMLNLGVIMMGFLGHEWSREYALNYFRLMLGLGVKFLSMQLIVVLSMHILQGWLQVSDLTWTQVLLILPTLLIIWGLVREVPALAQSLISGSDRTSGNSIAAIMQAVSTTANLATGAFAGAAAVGAASLGGGANMGSLLGNAWDQASGNDPATSPLPETDSDSSPGANNSADLTRSHGGDYQGSISGNSTEQSKLATAGKAVKIAGTAMTKETISSAKNAFMNGLKRPIEARKDTIIGRAAKSLDGIKSE